MTCKGLFYYYIIPSISFALHRLNASNVSAEKKRGSSQLDIHRGIEQRRPLLQRTELRKGVAVISLCWSHINPCGAISVFKFSFGEPFAAGPPSIALLLLLLRILFYLFSPFELSTLPALYTTPPSSSSSSLSRSFLRLLGALKKKKHGGTMGGKKGKETRKKKANSPIIVSIRRASARPCTLLLERGQK